MEQRYDKETGLPVDRSYLECGLPPYLQRSLDTMKRAWGIATAYPLLAVPPKSEPVHRLS